MADQQTNWLARQDRLTQLTAVAFNDLVGKITGVFSGKKEKNLEEAVAEAGEPKAASEITPARHATQPVAALSQDVLSNLPKLNGLVSYRMAAVVAAPRGAQPNLPSLAPEPEGMDHATAQA